MSEQDEQAYEQSGLIPFEAEANIESKATQGILRHACGAVGYETIYDMPQNERVQMAADLLTAATWVAMWAGMHPESFVELNIAASTSCRAALDDMADAEEAAESGCDCDGGR